MSRNLFVIPVWRRLSITRICLANLQLLDQDILCIVSHVDDADLLEEMNVPFIWHPNDFLGAKWNAGIMYASALDWDHIVTLGSDDIVKPSLLDFYARHDNQEVIITDKIYFIDTLTGRASIISRARIGAGRRISRKIIEKMKYRLWTDGLNSSLDRDSNANINRAGFATAEIRTDAHITGLKSNTNIWTYDHTLRAGQTCVIEEALNGIPDVIQAQIHALLPVPVK